MRRRSPARFLAPLALIAAAIAVYTVAQPEPSTTSGPTPSVATTQKAKPKKQAASYTVKAGDTLSGIAEKTGVPLETIQELNDVDANSLRVGRKLRLRA